MLIYRNNKAQEQGEIIEITAEKDKQFGKPFYSIHCTYLSNWTAPNGDTGNKRGITTNVDKLNKEELIKQLTERINKQTKN